MRCQWVEEDYLSRLQTSLILLISKSTAKTKLQKFTFLYCGEFVKTSENDLETFDLCMLARKSHHWQTNQLIGHSTIITQPEHFPKSDGYPKPMHKWTLKGINTPSVKCQRQWQRQRERWSQTMLVYGDTWKWRGEHNHNVLQWIQSDVPADTAAASNAWRSVFSP